jgi:hypothetical protein
VTASNRVYFVESLTLRAWLWTVFPSFIPGALRRRRDRIQCYVLYGSRLAMLMARISAAALGVSVRRLEYRLRDVYDDKGQMIRLRIDYCDMAEAQHHAIAEPTFQELLQSGQIRDRMPLYLAKAFVQEIRRNRVNLWHTLLLIQVCVWKTKIEDSTEAEPVMYIIRRPWYSSLNLYAAMHGVKLVQTFAPIDPYGVLKRSLPKPLIESVRNLRYRLSQGNLPQMVMSYITPRFSSDPVQRSEALIDETQTPKDSLPPKILVGYNGQLNLNQPHLHSDLSFWQRSPLEGDDLLVAFSLFNDPLNEEKQDQLSEHGIEAVVFNRKAATVPSARVFKPGKSSRKKLKAPAAIHHKGLTGAWLKAQLSNYQERRSYWTELLTTYNGKIYVTFQNADPSHIAIADALGDTGGILAMYQRSYEPNPTPMLAVYSDIAFRFSNATAPLEKVSNSVIQYHVATGYLGDHRFSLLRARSGAVRSELERHGAHRVLAYFDENSGDDDHVHTGHSFTQENYSFLLNKLLGEPWLGLVLKPKNPRSLRRRLGQVARLLQEAQATGRCYIYEGGPIQSPNSPTEAALEADLAIHGHLFAGTAGVEAALAGVPTLLLDREGWPVSPLYRLPKDKVVFTNWLDLWTACTEHWATEGGTAEFGDWSLLLDELDPFRDGRASERMGTYLGLLMEGFKAGLDRDTVMADAAGRYADQWGSDKVNQINGGWRPGELFTSDPRSTELIDLSKNPMMEQSLA